MAVSDAEKQADKNSRPASRPNRVLIERAAKGYSRKRRLRGAGGRNSAPKQHFHHELGAQIGQQQQGEARDRPDQRRAPAPAAEMPSRQQAAEPQPGTQGQTRL